MAVASVEPCRIALCGFALAQPLNFHVAYGVGTLLEKQRLLGITSSTNTRKLLANGERQSAQASGSRGVRVVSRASGEGMLWAGCARKVLYLLPVGPLVHLRDAAPKRRDMEYWRTLDLSVQRAYLGICFEQKVR